MPSSLICLSQDSLLELEQLQTYAQGEHTKRRHDEEHDDSFFFSTESEASFILPSVPGASLSTDFAPTVEAFAPCTEEVDSPPNLEFFGSLCFSLYGILRYFLDLKTPGSAGSVAAHQMYNPKTQ
ncbi:hypothetical protein PIB30_008798, partial [Stylosanthes scabra]|nr:hypothetical protein [Stylosanthes scabra]